MKHWNELLENDIVNSIIQKVNEERSKYNILPGEDDIFNAFYYTSFDSVKVVILGQDPYHTTKPNIMAHGLSFSVPPNIIIPKSLINIYKELESDVGVKRKHGCLIDWAEQGILLLNTSLTVREGKAGSHSSIGWEQVTDNIIQMLSQEKEHLVFILWGNHAIKKQKLINESKHCVITGVHPSPLSAHRGFFGSKPFSRTNQYLVKHNIPIIKW